MASTRHDLLPAERVERLLREEGVRVRACQYSPLVTLWTFLLQVLSPDHSCRDAVARLRVMQTADGQSPCSPGTTAYCKARQRLSERVCARLAREVSFTGTLQTLWAYRALIEQASWTEHDLLYNQMPEAVAGHRVGNRPNRFEPRAVKRRPKPHDLLTIPRKEAKRRLAA